MSVNRTLTIVLLTILTIVRILLANVNSAEWGDSYRILRASNFIREFNYPSDEKRPPLFSALLAIRPINVDAILWGRLFMLVVSLASYFVFYKLCQKLLGTEDRRLIALVFLVLNPIYLYWSLRIYADVFFSLLVLMCFYTFEFWKEKQKNGKKSQVLLLVAMGLLCGLSILTRFEGYILTFATLLGLLITGSLGIKDIKTDQNKLMKNVFAFLLVAGVVVLPWLIYRNPLASSYFKEPAGRKYDFEMVLTYLTSYLFVLGIIPAFAVISGYILKKPLINLVAFVKNYPHIVIFIALESLLILAWPAAVPRLFVPIIPFLVIGLVKSLDLFQSLKSSNQSTNAKKSGNKAFGQLVDTGKLGLASIILTILYILLQHKLRLQFLGPHTMVFLFITAVSAVCTLSIILKKQSLFILSAIISMTALTASTIYLHKDVYLSIKEVATFSLRERAGKVIHNDTAGIVNWYLPESEYKNLNEKKYLTQEYLEQNKVDYIIITNEFNPNMEIDLKKRSHLSLIIESTYKRGGKMFFTWLVGVNRKM